ncbi:MAG TPA: tRNA uridine-5-carboxymethylaminomethyl(34) synthesis GTPase MnmE [Pseudomonadales bacterium]|nr:tRNA uridine-5-carboxymethylaminomethyl(34) synthesis GTPase MnmE [Pseudomonadales bacterium]
MQISTDTIAAIATPPGRGGIGVVRISGKKALPIAAELAQIAPEKIRPRFARYSSFHSAQQDVIDQGLLLFFPGPNSFTGEDVIELQGHGGPVVMTDLLNRTVELGARLARPGEFSERAFLNDKIDLAQAEAIADLIDASSQQAARAAIRSLQGEFSNRVNQLVEALIHLRMYVEAAIDFPEEDIDFLSDGKIETDTQTLIQQTEQLLASAQQGSLMREGMSVVIAGRPNAGKSSLMNALTERESAIVTAIAGTTRDVLREYIHLDGMPLHLIDTAGLREATDVVEQEGIKRAWQEIEKADCVLLVSDLNEQPAPEPEQIWPEFISRLPSRTPIIVVQNKIDQAGLVPAVFTNAHQQTVIRISAKQQLGMDALKAELKRIMGFNATLEGSFIARQRHLEAIRLALAAIRRGKQQLVEFAAGELLAEELRLAQQHLSEITGQFTADDLLGKIFSSFCIGK